MLGNTLAAAAATSWEMELLTPDTAPALFYGTKNHASSLQSDVWAQGPFSILHWDLFFRNVMEVRLTVRGRRAAGSESGATFAAIR